MTSIRPITAALALLALASGCGGRKQPTPQEDRAARARAAASLEGLGALPADTQVVVGANVAKLRESSLARRAIGQMLATNPEDAARLDALVTRCKLDPARDLDSVIVGLGRGGSRREVVLVAKGRFDEAGLVECVRASLAEKGGALEERTIAGARAWVARPPRAEHPVAFAFGAPGTLLVASGEEWLAKAMNADAPKIEAAPAMMRLVEGADVAAALWGAGVMTPDVGGRLPEITGGAVKAPATAIFGHLRVTDGVKVELNLEMASEDDAKALAQFTKGQVAQFAMLAQAYGLGAVVGEIKPSSRERTFRVVLDLDAAELAQLEAAIDKRTGK